MTVAAAVVDVLREENVPFVAGIPGSGIMDYLDVIARAGSPRFVLVRHEQVAAHMALGYAEYTGRPAAVLVSRAPGASNTVIAVQAAFLEGSPLVVITSHVSSKTRGLGAFQETDLAGLFAPITKLSAVAPSPERVPNLLREAFRVAVTGKPGPVHVSIPLDFAPLELEDVEKPLSGHSLVATTPPAEFVRRAAAMLSAAHRPAIIAGGGVTKAGAPELVLELADALSAAVVNTWEKKAVREDHPLAVGMMGRGGTGASALALREADVILALGTRFSERATADYRMHFSTEQRLIQVDVDPGCIGRVLPVALGAVADAGETVQALLDELPRGRARDEWRARIAGAREVWEREIDAVDWDAHPIVSPRVMRDLRAALNRDAVVSCDSGNFNYWLARYFPATANGAYIYPAGSGPMGCGLPAAMGIKAAFPERQVVCVAGDGGFAMTMQDLETCVRERIDVVSVVVNNFGYGNIKIRQQTQFGNRLIGCEFGNPDFAAVAQLFGAHGERVETAAELLPALERALAHDGPAVLDVLVDPDEICTATIDPWWE